MRVYDNGSLFSVSVSPSELQDFAERWPCSGMRGATRGMWFQFFDKQNGDLVDIKGERKGYDGGAVKALSEDAQAYGEKQFRCTNCGGPLPTDHGTTSKDGKHRFCDACAGLAEALNIGARKPAFLYDDGKGGVIAWTSGVPPLGFIVRKTTPQTRFQPVRYLVRMLDRSMWYGTGPSSNGNYVRLRPMKERR